ncbi:acyl transferase [Dyadobacter frigoris]|uniref:Acyl transferase n=1 Tax=Dyadobacter frigoris TaxID=2576211 RepID=A0A4U6CXW0_9BACT|nr:acyl transferase [Dyadobacter frigoris]TKT88551.1 acyl transferase [Dyadobacter frigoris]GLU54598.1 acyltransferase [Dyadobacter frigoris]
MKLQSNKSSLEIRQELRRQIIDLDQADFESLALRVFQYQAENNPVYKEYISHLHIKTDEVSRLTEIPFLPIQFFKHHLIKTGNPPEPTVIFESSGTTGAATSRHALYDAPLYKSVSTRIFQQNYGHLDDFHMLVLLPSYLERNNSSLVYMMQHFIDQADSPLSNFYLHNTGEMIEQLKNLAENPDGRGILLMGVTFALLDLAESAIDFSFLKNIPNLRVMDTGGMKGRRQELLREEVHDILTGNFGVSKIHSEYGMTELLSQSYSQGDGLFHPGTTMRILLRDVNDPFSIYDHNLAGSKTGGINIIDLANLDSCSFIETQDLGRFGVEPGAFYVMGRFDNSDIRGCNLLVL